MKYSAPSHEQLSFNQGEKVKILSKEAGSNLDLWGVEVGLSATPPVIC